MTKQQMQKQIDALQEQLDKCDCGTEIAIGSLCMFWNIGTKSLGVLTEFDYNDKISPYRSGLEWYERAELANVEETPLPWIESSNRPEEPKYNYCIVIERGDGTRSSCNRIYNLCWDKESDIVKYAIINLTKKK